MKVAILKLRGVLLTSIQFELSDDDALQFQSDVLEKVAETEARAIIIDITGMDVVDSYMARVLNDTASMTRLLGARAVICGMHPAVAQTLVELGRDLVGVRTALNLDHAMDILERELAAEGGKPLHG